MIDVQLTCLKRDIGAEHDPFLQVWRRGFVSLLGGRRLQKATWTPRQFKSKTRQIGTASLDDDGDFLAA
jgi:hypothetical protein